MTDKKQELIERITKMLEPYENGARVYQWAELEI